MYVCMYVLCNMYVCNVAIISSRKYVLINNMASNTNVWQWTSYIQFDTCTLNTTDQFTLPTFLLWWSLNFSHSCNIHLCHKTMHVNIQTPAKHLCVCLNSDTLIQKAKKKTKYRRLENCCKIQFLLALFFLVTNKPSTFKTTIILRMWIMN